MDKAFILVLLVASPEIETKLYDDAWHEAIKTSRPLVVFYGVKPRRVPGAVVAYRETCKAPVGFKGVLVGVPDEEGDDVIWARGRLDETATNKEIVRVFRDDRRAPAPWIAPEAPVVLAPRIDGKARADAERAMAEIDELRRDAERLRADVARFRKEDRESTSKEIAVAVAVLASLVAGAYILILFGRTPRLIILKPDDRKEQNDGSQENKEPDGAIAR